MLVLNINLIVPVLDFVGLVDLYLWLALQYFCLQPLGLLGRVLLCLIVLVDNSLHICAIRGLSLLNRI